MLSDKHRDMALQLTIVALENDLIRPLTSRNGSADDTEKYAESVSNVISKTYLKILEKISEKED